MTGGFIFNIQRYSLHDGPGIRTTVFLKGCPLRCWWCHNPEGISPEPELATFENRCVACGECVRACPQAVCQVPVRADERCVHCGACAEACPTGARHLMGHSASVAETLAEVLKDRPFYDDSGGGVTFSGGEPMAQFGFLREALAACRGQGIHTVVDTTGYCPQADLLAVAPLTDLFLYDLKVIDPELHLRYIGIPNEPILENLRVLSRQHGNIWIRMPIVPGLNDAPALMEASARFVADLPGVTLVNLLPYHRTGLQKFKRLGKPLPWPGTDSPSAADLDRLSRIFHCHGLRVRVGG